MTLAHFSPTFGFLPLSLLTLTYPFSFSHSVRLLKERCPFGGNRNVIVFLVVNEAPAR